MRWKCGIKNVIVRMAKIIRVTTVPLAFKALLRGQMKYMKEEGYEVIMVSADGKERSDVMSFEGCPHEIIPMTRKITPWKDLKSLWMMYRFFKKEKPDIVHSHTPKAGLIAMLAAKAAGIKIRVHTIAGLRFMTASGITYKILVQMEKLTARAATQIWPNSLSLLGYVTAQKLVNPAKLEVIGKGSSNGINLARFSKSALQQETLEETARLINYDPSLFYILSVGRIVKDKGISELVLSFVSLYEENDKLRLVLVGAFEDDLDPVDPDIMQLIKTHPGIILPGWHDEVEYFMQLCNLLVHPSYREGFPNVVLQAGAMGCPVVCSRIPGNIDIVDEDVSGLVCAAKNKEELLAKLKQAIANPEKMKEMASVLQKKIEDNFDIRYVHQQLSQRYRSLLTERDNRS